LYAQRNTRITNEPTGLEIRGLEGQTEYCAVLCCRNLWRSYPATVEHEEKDWGEGLDEYSCSLYWIITITITIITSSKLSPVLSLKIPGSNQTERTSIDVATVR
jgi:hypothetical protein